MSVHLLLQGLKTDLLWSVGETVFFPPWLQNHCPGVAILNFLCFCVFCPCTRAFWSTANFLSFTCKLCYVFSSLCVAMFSYQRTSYTALPLLWDLLSLLTDFYPLLLPSIPVWLQAVLSLRKARHCMRPKDWDFSGFTLMPFSQTSIISLFEHPCDRGILV